MTLIDDFAELFWEIDSLGKLDNKQEFILKVKPLLRDLILKIRSGGNV